MRHDSVSEIDTEGLICAFRLAPWAELEAKTSELLPSPEPVWVHFNLLDNRARRYLENDAGLDEEGRELLLEKETRAKSVWFSGGFALSVVDLYYDFSADPENFGALRIYVDERRVISCRKHRLRSVDRVRRRMQAEGGGTQPREVFQSILEEIAQGFGTIASELVENVEEAEDRILAGRSLDQSAELGRIRRLLARLRRHVSANRTALVPLLRRFVAAGDAEAEQRLRETLERFDAVSQDMELVSERARALQEEIGTRLGEATNRNLYVLSTVTTALLPITLITGIFGMNVGGLPFLGSAHGFWWVILGMSLAVIGILLLLRRRGVIR